MKITPNQFAWVFVIVLVALAGWGVYAVVHFIKQPAANIISVENEIKFGEMIEEQSVNEANGYRRLHDSIVDSAMQIIHQRLMSGLGDSDYDYTIQVIDQTDANAFAIPGGKIFVQTGLIQFCHSPEELAAVLAHEMGHVEKRHTINQLVKQLGVTTLIGILTDANGGVVEKMSGDLLSKMFSREDESEADDFALHLLERCGIEPTMLGEVFQRMKNEQGDMTGAMNLLSTHPELEERSSKAARFQVDSGFEKRPITLDWPSLQNHISEVAASNIR